MFTTKVSFQICFRFWWSKEVAGRVQLKFLNKCWGLTILLPTDPFNLKKKCSLHLQTTVVFLFSFPFSLLAHTSARWSKLIFTYYITILYYCVSIIVCMCHINTGNTKLNSVHKSHTTYPKIIVEEAYIDVFSKEMWYVSCKLYTVCTF